MKSLGVLLVLLSALLLSRERMRPEKRRMDRLGQLCASLQLLRGELLSRPSSLEELCALLTAESEGETADFFRALAQGMERLNRESFREIWETELEKQMPDLQQEEKRELEELGSVLGRFDLDEQQKALERCLTHLHKLLERLQENYPVKQKLCIGISCSLAAMLILVLL